jgi:hypothetical protein
MKWLQWYPTRRDVMGVVLAVVIVCVFAFVMIRLPDIQQRGANAGFGPDWECTPVPQGDPVCIKKLGH